MPEKEKGWVRQWMLRVVGVLASFVLLAVLILMLPPVQRWCVVSLLDSPELDRVTVDHVRVRPGSFAIEGLVIEADGMRMSSGLMQGNGPLWKGLLGGGLHLDDYRADDWRLWLDLRTKETGETRSVPAVSALVFGPLALELERADLAGQVEVVLSEDRTLTLETLIRGSDFGRGRTAVLEVEGELFGLRADGEASPVRLRSELARPLTDAFLEVSLTGGLVGARTPCFLTVRTRYEPTMLTTEGVIDLDLPALEAVFLDDDSRTLASGQAELKFQFTSNLSGETMMEGELLATDLVVAGSGYRIERIASPWQAVLNPGESLLLRLPLEVERVDLVSDLLVAVSAVADEPTWRMEGSLSGQQIASDDLAILAALFRVPPDRDEVDLNPAWRDLRGELELDFQQVLIREGLQMKDLRGTVNLSDESLRFSDLSARLAGGTLGGALELTFDPSTAEPHHLEGTWTARGVESAQLLGDGIALPVLEGPFGAELLLQATGPNLRMLGERLTGELALLGGPGIFRGLGDHAQKASSLAGMLGALFRSDSLQAVAELSQQLSAVRYDQIRLDLNRLGGAGLEVGRIQLQGPDLKLAGAGWIGSEGTVDFLGAPMNFEFRLGAKGVLAELLGEVGLTSIGRIDAEGYRTMPRSFSIRGTPTQPDVSELWALLRKAAVEAVFGE